MQKCVPRILLTDLNNSGLLFQAKCGVRIKSGDKEKVMISGAVDPSKKVAIKKATYEFYERLQSVYRGKGITLKSLASIKSNFVSPYTLVKHSREKLPHIHDAVYWAKSRNLDTKSFAYIPATSVFSFYNNNADTFQLKIDANGLAAHSSLGNAVLHGFLEVIERDQIQLFWDAVNAPGLQLNGWEGIIDSKIKIFLDRYSYAPTIVYLDEFSKLGLHTVLALLSNEEGKITIGSATDTDVISVIRRAILEGIMLHETVKTCRDKKLPRYPRNSLERVLLGYKNSNRLQKYVSQKIKQRIEVGKILNYTKPRNTVFEKVIGPAYSYEFPRAANGAHIVRVVVPAAHRRHEPYKNAKQIRSERLLKYLDKYGHEYNNLANPYG